MKKVLLLVAALFLVVSLSACNFGKTTMECKDGSGGVEEFVYDEDGLYEYNVTESNGTYTENDEDGVEYVQNIIELSTTGDDFVERMDQFADMVADLDITCEVK